MKTGNFRTAPRMGRSRARAFTMVEIAIALGVIAFALVAIIGILPSGMQVQKESREKTIINEEARYFLDAIKSGSLDLDDLPEFVDLISTAYGLHSNFVDGAEVIGLLSTPGTNQAIVRALTGSAINRGTNGRDFAFKYQMTLEIDRAHTVSPDHPDRGVLETNLWDVRLQFDWPLLPNHILGTRQAVYRGLISGNLINSPPGSIYYYFRP